MRRRQRVGFEELQLISSIASAEAIGHWLDGEGICYSLDERRLPWTTVAAIERCLGARCVQARYPYSDIAMEF